MALNPCKAVMMIKALALDLIKNLGVLRTGCSERGREEATMCSRIHSSSGDTQVKETEGWLGWVAGVDPPKLVLLWSKTLSLHELEELGKVRNPSSRPTWCQTMLGTSHIGSRIPHNTAGRQCYCLRC